MTTATSTSASPRPARTRLLLTAPALLLALAACGGAAPTASPGATGTPTSNPTTAPTPTAVAGIQHPTGAKDVVLRFEQGGGFMPVEFMATNAPSFTLYGDGTVVFRDPTAMPPEFNDGVVRNVPFQTVNIGEDGIQALLSEALGPGGLAIAQGPYMGMGADIPTATFTVFAGGQKKEVSVVGLSPDMHPQNVAIVTQLSKFAEKLGNFGKDAAGEVPYVPAAFRGVLNKVDQPFGPVVEWPWQDVKPSDFKSGENEFLLTRTLTVDEIEALGVPQIGGGMTGVSLSSGGQVYTFSLRPLLPDEAS
jgi:hypothetical protein